jgi:hypothetical protein
VSRARGARGRVDIGRAGRGAWLGLALGLGSCSVGGTVIRARRVAAGLGHCSADSGVLARDRRGRGGVAAVPCAVGLAARGTER